MSSVETFNPRHGHGAQSELAKDLALFVMPEVELPQVLGDLAPSKVAAHKDPKVTLAGLSLRQLF